MEETSNVSSFRVGTWNILSPSDELDPDYGCPLQIAICQHSNTTPTSSSNETAPPPPTDDDKIGGGDFCNGTTTATTRARYQRIWHVLEDQAAALDVMCLQEASDLFWSLHNSSSSSSSNNTVNNKCSETSNSSLYSNASSHWTLVHQSGECAILHSTFSKYSVVVGSQQLVDLPNLSGCPALPLLAFSLSHTNNNSNTSSRRSMSAADDDDYSSATTTTFLVGSVHVQASVTNMSEWYATAAALLLQNTTFVFSSSSNDDTDPLASPTSNRSVVFVLGGDFNHNLTDVNSNKNASSSGAVHQPDHWSVVAAEHDKNNSWLPTACTSQKEHNWMGSFDGFWVSEPYIWQQQQQQDQEYSNPLQNHSLRLESSQVKVHIEGFMPKVVLGLPQGGVEQSITQFAVITTSVTSNGTTVITGLASIERIQEWSTDDDVLQLVFNSASDFSSIIDGGSDSINASNITGNSSAEMLFAMPHSNPRTQVLSDHMMVSASFLVYNTSDDTAGNNTTTNKNNTTDAPTKGNQTTGSNQSIYRTWTFSLIGTLVVGGALILLLMLVRKRKRRMHNTRGHSDHPTVAYRAA